MNLYWILFISYTTGNRLSLSDYTVLWRLVANYLAADVILIILQNKLVVTVKFKLISHKISIDSCVDVTG